MNAKLFSDALSEIGDPYIMRALVKRRPKPSSSDWWRCHKIAACFSAIVFIAAVSFGTALAVSADFRQAIVSVLFPRYTENQLHEIDEGHRTGSFDMQDTLLTFLEKFNNEAMAEGITVKKENGFEYVVLPGGENSVNVIAACTTPNDKLLVTMERKAYKETTGLWQVTAYQILDAKTASAMIDRSR